MYTSGTTGKPKGAVLLHRNIIAAVRGVLDAADLDSSSVHLSYLPLAHIFECASQAAVTAIGGSIGFSEGDIKLLVDDLGKLQPTFMCGVPRVFTRIYQKIMAGVESKGKIARMLFNMAFNSESAAVRQGNFSSTFLGRKVFTPLRSKLGMGRMKFIITGAAPTPPYLIEFLKVLAGCPVIQGYGMTETGKWYFCPCQRSYLIQVIFSCRNFVGSDE